MTMNRIKLTTFTGRKLRGQTVTLVQDRQRTFSVHLRGGLEDYDAEDLDLEKALAEHDAMVAALLIDCPMCQAETVEENTPQEQLTLL